MTPPPAAATLPVGAAVPARRSIGFLSAAAFVSAATMRVADPLLPQVAEEFAVTAGSASVVTTAFALAYGLCQIVWGPLGDRLGKLRVVMAALFASAIVVGASALAPSLPALGLCRLLSGITAAAIIPLSIAYIGDVVDYADRQTTLARYISGQILGLVFGQVIGGVLGQLLGWRHIFLILALCYLGVGTALWRLLRRSPSAGAPRHAPPRVLASYAAVLANPWARIVLLAAFLEGFLFFGGFTYIGAFIREAYGLSFTLIGAILGCFGIGGFAYTFSVRTLVARLGQRGLSALGGAFLGLCFIALPLGAPAPALALIAVLIGLGFYMVHNTLQTNATQMAPELRGVAVAIFALAFFLGQALGGIAAGLAIDRLGYGPVFVANGTLLILLGLWLQARLGHRDAAA
jgi:MFS transporter, YNFM family, putative membrane transport protein